MAATLLIIYKHDANIQRLVEGVEPKFTVTRSDKQE
jgi:glycerol-3-phosphate acyltransferase PlsY